MVLKIEKDHQRFRQIVKGKIRDDLRKFLTKGELIGKEGKHLSLRVRGGGRSLKLIAWRWGGYAGDLAAGMRIDALVTPKLSEWNGSVMVEAELHDVRQLR